MEGKRERESELSKVKGDRECKADSPCGLLDRECISRCSRDLRSYVNAHFRRASHEIINVIHEINPLKKDVS